MLNLGVTFSLFKESTLNSSMIQKIFFFAALVLPAMLFSQTPLDSTTYKFPVLGASTTPPLTWMISSSVTIDRKTDSLNRIATYERLKIKRDTTKPIIISRDSIRQDNKIVGYFIFSPGKCFVYNPGGFLMASAANTTNNLWRINYFVNGKQHDLVSNGFFEQDIAEYLIKQGYL
jgi:hypothetical protein